MSSEEALRRQACGLRGEDVAARHLESHGWRIADRRFRIAGGELDLVAWDGPQLVFVEVRTRGTSTGPRAEDTLAMHKRRVLQRAANAYLSVRCRRRTSARFDVIAVDARTWTVTAHYRGAFDGA
jgi:putative endonuclease